MPRTDTLSAISCTSVQSVSRIIIATASVPGRTNNARILARTELHSNHTQTQISAKKARFLPTEHANIKLMMYLCLQTGSPPALFCAQGGGTRLLPAPCTPHRNALLPAASTPLPASDAPLPATAAARGHWRTTVGAPVTVVSVTWPQAVPKPQRFDPVCS